jgi:DHA2 family multidrug resistance protein
MSRPLNRPMITLSVMLATIIQALDTTIANVALPHMQGSLSASQDQITWVLTSYIVAAAIATPLNGWLCDRFSQKRVFLAAIVGFTVASVLCGLSLTLGEIVAMRLLQGLFGAALVPISQAVMLEINPPEKRGSAMAAWGVGVMLGPILGPSLGGWLTDNYDWRWVFFINLPIGVLAYFGVLRFLPGAKPRRAMRFDSFGFATLSLAIGALQMMLDRGQDNDWFNSFETWIEAAVFVVSLAYFFVHTRYTRPSEAFLDLRVFKNPNFTSGVIIIFVVGMVLYAVRALTPPMLQGLMDMPILAVGLLTAPTGLGTMVAMQMVGKLVGRIDARAMLLTGFLITAFSLWQMSSYTLTISKADIVLPGIIQGFGLGLVFVPLSTVTFATLEPAMYPQATALYSLARNIGSSIGISMVQTVLVRNTAAIHAAMAERVNPMNLALRLGAAGPLDPSTPQGLAVINGEVTRQAAMLAYIDDFRLMLMLTIAVLPLLWLIRPPGRGAAADTSHAIAD